MIETGTVLQQRYKIDKQIGQGGMGAVYVATDARFGSTVAIKETLCMDDSFRKAIEREARLLNSLKHAALPRVSDHFEENNGMFLVMEYIPGDDVAAMLENESVAFSVEQVMKWADQLLDALDYLHTQEMPVIHRDIKPQNLKINSRGEAILLDFGLAKGNPTDASHQTAAKSIFGYSRNYASLEQIQGTGTDPRSDLYSLAATLYHLLTRVAPDDALTRAMSVLSQKPDPLAPANAVNSAVPRGVAGVLRKALDLNAGERPASAQEMRQMLRESENYAYLADNATIADNISDPQVFAQQTKLMPAATKAGLFNDPNAKTAVMPGFSSEQTSVRSDATEPVAGVTAAPPRGRGLGVAAGALMMLLVGVVIAGGVYFVQPSLFGSGDDSREPAKSPTATTEAATTGNSAPLTESKSVDLGGTETLADTDKHRTENVKPGEQDKQPETGKSAKSTDSSKSKKEEDLGETTEITVDDPDIPPGGVVLTDRDDKGKVTTLRVMPAGPPQPNMQRQPLPNRMNPFPYGVNPRNMTPQQRMIMQKFLRNNPQIRPPKPGN